MHILYIGSFCTKDIVSQFSGYGLDIYKTSEFVIKGLRQKEGIDLDVITAPDVPSYPRLPKISFRRQIDKEESVTSVGFLNIVGIKQLSIVRHLYNEAKHIIKRKDGKVYIIIPYMVFHHVAVTRLLKLKFGEKVVICQTIPDIFFPTSKLSAGYWLNYFAEKMAVKNDLFILFTKQMADYLGLQKEHYIIMECIIDSTPLEQSKDENTEALSNLKVLYTGALSDHHGIRKLIDIMPYLERNDFSLGITGIGPLSSYIEENSKKDSRIVFYGAIEKKEVFKKQNEADILINPRSDKDSPQLTKYMFPSKLVEYMLAGKPVVICKMSGIPEEYYKYVITAKDDSVETIAKTLNYILNMRVEDRKAIGEKAKEFILKNKTVSVQTQRIMDFFNKF